MPPFYGDQAESDIEPSTATHEKWVFEMSVQTGIISYADEARHMQRDEAPLELRSTLCNLDIVKKKKNRMGYDGLIAHVVDSHVSTEQAVPSMVAASSDVSVRRTSTTGTALEYLTCKR